MKWIIRILLFLLILIMGNFGLKQLAKQVKNQDNILNNFLTRHYNSNTFKIVSDDLDIRHIDVRFSSKEPEPMDIVLIENGKYLHDVPNVYGPQTIHVVLLDTLSFDIKHRKTNWWHQHHYVLKVELVGDELTASLQIFGPNPEYWKAYFSDKH